MPAPLDRVSVTVTGFWYPDVAGVGGTIVAARDDRPGPASLARVTPLGVERGSIVVVHPAEGGRS